MTLPIETPPGVLLRPAQPGDYAFAKRLYLETTRPLLQALGTWDRAAVTERFSSAYHRHEAQVICADGRDIGWLQVSRNEAGLHLHQMHLVKRYRNRGIGTRLIRTVMARAQGLGLPLTLNVIRGNPAAALYLRLGFCIFDEDREMLRMRWNGESREP